MEKPLSKAEKEFIRNGIDALVREDGRSLEDLRSIVIEREVIPHVNGSSHVKVGGSIEVVCSVKAEISEPLPESPSEGCINFTTEISSSCSAFSVHVEERQLAGIGAEISHHLQSFYNGSNSIDLASLGIIDGKYCWTIHVDVVVLQCDSYPLDACSIATREALLCTKLPQLQMKVGDSGLPENFDVCGDISSTVALPTKDLPICLSVAKVGENFLSDISLNEYLSAECVYTVVLDKHSQFCGVAKVSGAALTVPEMFALLQVGQRVHSKVEDIFER